MTTVPKRSKLDDELKLRIDADLKSRLQAVCDETGQKMSAVARFLLVAGLVQHEKEQAKTGRK